MANLYSTPLHVGRSIRVRPRGWFERTFRGEDPFAGKRGTLVAFSDLTLEPSLPALFDFQPVTQKFLVEVCFEGQEGTHLYYLDDLDRG
jgi:hypothetical protein